MNNPLFSIVLTTFKREHLLARAIRSVLKQSFKDFELIIIDDGGSEVTERIVSSFEDERIILISNKQNLGVAASRNIGIRSCSGKYISFLDDDDEYYCEFLLKTKLFFETADENIGFVWTGIRRVKDTDTGVKEWYTKIFPKHFQTREEGLLAVTTIGNGFGLTFRKEVLQEVGYYNELFETSEDTEFLFRVARITEFATIPEILILIHQHGCNQLTDNGKDLQRLENYQKILDSNTDLTNKYPELYYVHHLRIIELFYSLNMKKKGRQIFWEIIKITPHHFSIYPDFVCFELFGISARKGRELVMNFLRKRV